MITIIEALSKLKPNAKWNWRGDDYEGLEWLDQNQTKPTEQEILDKQSELQTEYNNNQYQRDRKAEYPPLEEQLDYIYHNGVDAWKTDIINPIKNKYPKQ